ncbi:MAG: hypothetical protein HY769_00605 [Candidatus Stahlbacteria bacterium]|nr:hypothetical protein [Candidatus Stahlbacteria bacterium]
MSIFFVFIIFRGIVFAEEVQPQTTEGGGSTSNWKWLSTTNAKFEIGFGYDNNLFKLSQENIDKFVNNEDICRFARIESYDDFVTNERITVDFTKRLLADEATRMRFKYNRYQYAVNPIKDYQSLILNVRQNLMQKQFIQIGYLFLPQYYIRDYFDADFQSFMRCDFREHLLDVKLGSKFLYKTTLAAIYKYEIYDYNSCFDEYDTRATTVGLSGERKLSKDISAEIEFGLKSAIAKGYDEDDEMATNSDESDISYKAYELIASLEYKIRKWCMLWLGYEEEYRNYTTKKSIEDDPFHRDRKDIGHILSGGIECNLAPTCALNISYTYRKRDTDSPNKAAITEIKDYTNYIISCGLVFTWDNKY